MCGRVPVHVLVLAQMMPPSDHYFLELVVQLYAPWQVLYFVGSDGPGEPPPQRAKGHGVLFLREQQ